jgi:hypothetical protein
VGKSREYVTNSIRLLALPEHMLQALSEKKISEGHTRPLLMLVDRPEEQEVLFKEIIFRKITVREAESIARRVAVDRVRKKDASIMDPEIREFETKLNQALGTRVLIEKREQGGKVVIDFFNNDDLRHIIDLIEKRNVSGVAHSTAQFSGNISGEHLSKARGTQEAHVAEPNQVQSLGMQLNALGNAVPLEESATIEGLDSRSAEIDSVENGDSGVETPADDSTPADQKEDEDLYSIKNFSV